jgi:uncharacterized protein YabN with tetrapyrrole methylase and pyrophosphatase domain
MPAALTVVGTGIRAIQQITRESEAAIRAADALLYLVAEPLTERWLRDIHPQARSLAGFYAEGKPRAATYHEMTAAILACLDEDLNVTVALYGHPGVLAKPAHEAVRRARALGIPARMLPAISAADCLFADLGIDPGAGCQTYEASDFVIRPRGCDIHAYLVLWQPAAVGVFDYSLEGSTEGLRALQARLVDLYPRDHTAVIYEACEFPVGDARADVVVIDELADADIRPLSTLVIPPVTDGATARERP